MLDALDEFFGTKRNSKLKRELKLIRQMSADGIRIDDIAQRLQSDGSVLSRRILRFRIKHTLEMVPSRFKHAAYTVKNLRAFVKVFEASQKRETRVSP